MTSSPKQPIAGTTPFDGDQARKGYALNKMCYSFNSAENRERFRSDEVGYMLAYGLNPEQTAAVRQRDVLGLLIAWGATILAKRKPGGRYTYGLRSSSIVAALFNALLLLIAIVVIAYEAIGRLALPEPVAGSTVITVAAIGIVINTATALLFMRGSKNDINIRGAFLHMAADAAVSAGVVVAGFVILATGWLWIDAAVSLVIVTVIAIGTWGLLRDSVNMSLHASPSGIDPDKVAKFLRQRPGVSDLHDLHIWPMSTTETALTVHLILPGGYPGDGFAHGIAADLQARFAIDHTTIQIEIEAGTDCKLEPDHVV